MLFRIIGVAVLGIAASAAHAKEVTVCNAAPFAADLAVSTDTGAGHRTDGWYELQPGSCRRFTGLVGEQFYYRADSYDDLSKWLNRGRPIRWSGAAFLCIHPTEAFQLPARGECAHRAGFTSVRLAGEQQTITLYEGNHRGVALSNATELRRILTGRMEFEQFLIRNPGREAPFQLGAWTSDTGGEGALITKIQPGMPAEAEGLAVGDRIVELNGYAVTSSADVANILDELDILRTEPVAMAVVRNGARISGTIEPQFFEWNHREYESSGAISTVFWSGLDGIFLTVGNELACASVIGLSESMQALADDKDFDGKRFANDTAGCSKQLNRDLAKRELLYPTAAKVAFWASLIVPEGALLKGTKLVRTLPLAARSRFVSRNK